MSIGREIVKAIGAHAKWKVRLRHAIDGGIAEADMTDIGRDDKCAFGQWIFGPTISEQTRASIEFFHARELHAKFHDVAGRIMKLVTQGNKTEADGLLQGEYEEVSSQLIAMLIMWKRRIEQKPAGSATQSSENSQT